MITARGGDNSSEEAVTPTLPVTADTQGRLRVSKAQRRDILAALVRSGESLPQFARRTGLKYSTLARWVQRRRPKSAGRSPRLRLVEAVMESPPNGGVGPALVVELPGQGRMAISTVKQVELAAALLRELAKPC